MNKQLLELLEAKHATAVLKLRDKDTGQIYYTTTTQTHEQATRTYEHHTMLRLLEYIRSN